MCTAVGLLYNILLNVKGILHTAISFQLVNYITLLNSKNNNNDKAKFLIKTKSDHFRLYYIIKNGKTEELGILQFKIHNLMLYQLDTFSVWSKLLQKEEKVDNMHTHDKTCRTYFMKGYIMCSKYHWYAEYVPPCKVLVCLIQTNLLKWCKSNIYSPLISFIILCPYGDKISTSRICRYKRTIKMSKVFVYRQESDKIC